LGDDGAGPEVVKYLKQNYHIPENVELIDAGTGIRDLLFDITLAEKKPRKIIIVDAVDVGEVPGEILEISLENSPPLKIDNFSRHQLPTSNLLRDLRELCSVDVKILAIQVENIPDVVSPGISKAVIRSIPKLCERILEGSK
jgi:coenzyme F420 hydrogenase subunit delta